MGFNDHLLDYILYGLCLLSIVVRYLFPLNFRGWFFVIGTIIYAWTIDRISLPAIPILGIVGLLTYYLQKVYLPLWLYFFSFVMVFLIGSGLFYHIIPGFENWKIATVTLSKHSYPYSMYLNLDKIFLALFLMGSVRASDSKEPLTTEITETYIPVTGVCATILIILGLSFGFVRWNPKFPSLLPWFAMTNLFFVCVSEEIFYRGFLQRSLDKFSFSPHVSILVAAVFFGLNHYTGGPVYMAIATTAGIFYGISYYVSQRIEVPIFVHFTINMLHFTLFSYPARIQ